LEHLLDGPDHVPAHEVFALFLSVAESAVAFGYGQDWHGMDVIDRVLRRCLAERPKLLSETGTLEVVSRTVDSFLNAGWYKAYLARDLNLS